MPSYYYYYIYSLSARMRQKNWRVMCGIKYILVCCIRFSHNVILVYYRKKRSRSKQIKRHPACLCTDCFVADIAGASRY